MSASDVTLWIVRHGETEWNIQGRIQGHGDSPLTAMGIAQAQALAQLLAAQHHDDAIAEHHKIFRVMSSDAGRAHHTARILAAGLKLDVATTPSFRERSYGIAEGMTYAEIDTHYPGAFSKVHETDPDYCIPQGESRRSFHHRVINALEDVCVHQRNLSAAVAQRPVLIVCHGGLLGAIYRWATNMPIATAASIPIPNTGMNKLKIIGGDIRNGAEILSWGEVSHL
jgi:2,3-bisphosphoglycerate-dependent phosphoglycerate mutase